MPGFDNPSQGSGQPEKKRGRSESRTGFRRPRQLRSADDVRSAVRRDTNDPTRSGRIPFFDRRDPIFDTIDPTDAHLIVRIQDGLAEYTGENAETKKNFFTQQINECLSKPNAKDFKARMQVLKRLASEQLEIDPGELGGTPEDSSDYAD